MQLPVNIKRLIVITVITLFIIGSIIYFTADWRTLQALKKINKIYFLFGILFFILEVTFDALRQKILIRGTGHKIGYWESYKIVFLQIFFDVLTPFSFGGQPFQIYVLHKKGIPTGSATTAVITKLFLGAIALMLIVVWAMLFYGEIFITAPLFKVMINITGGILFVLILLFIMGLYNPKPTTVIISGFFYLLWKLKIAKHPEKFKNTIIRQLILAKKSFDGYIGHRFFYFFIGFILSLFMFIFSILMLICFIKGFHIPFPLGEGIAVCGSLIFLITFIPTPGSSGLGEGVFYLLFKAYIPTYLIGVIIFLWRLFFQYISAFLGAFITAHFAHELLTQKKLN